MRYLSSCMMKIHQLDQYYYFYAFNQIMKPSALKRHHHSNGDSDKLTFNGATVDIEEKLQESECNAAESTFRG